MSEAKIINLWINLFNSQLHTHYLDVLTRAASVSFQREKRMNLNMILFSPSMHLFQTCKQV